MRISFVHTKGGCGKTTSSIYLAAAAHQAGMDVEVLDADPQSSASQWATLAKMNGDPLGFAVKEITARTLARYPASHGWQIVDTPPGNPDQIQAAIDSSDLIIIPTQPSPLDLARVWPTLEVLHGHHVGVLVVRGQENRILFNETREVFEEQGVETFYNFVPEREDIKGSFGSNPHNLFTYPEIFQEINQIEEF